MRSPIAFPALVLAAAGLLACEQGAGGGAKATRRGAALTAPSPGPGLAPASRFLGLRELDRTPDAVLWGRQLAAPIPETERGAVLALLVSVPPSATPVPLAVPPAIDARLAPKGTRLAALEPRGQLRLADAAAPASPARALDQGVLPGLAFSPDGLYVAYARRDDDPRPRLVVADARTLERRVLTPPDQAPVDRPAFSQDGRFVFAVGSDASTGLAQVLVFHLESGRRSVLTNAGLPAPAGDGRPPAGFVPPPIGPVPMRHVEGRLLYDAGDAQVELPVTLFATGDAKAGEAVVRPHGGAR